jgi:hypothetical protein
MTGRKIISRADAKASGLKRFFTGARCTHGHVAERLVSNGACTECDRLRDEGRRSAKRGGAKPRPPKHEPTAESRNTVLVCSGAGMTVDQIAKIVPGGPIDRHTLAKHYRQELDAGAAKTDEQVIKSAFRQAVGGNALYDAKGLQLRPATDPVVAMTIFWLKTRLRWRQPPEEHRFAGPGGGPMQTLDVTGANAELLSELTEEELNLLENLSTKFAARIAGGDKGGKG